MTAKTEKQLVIILTIISINLSLILALSAYAERPVDTLEGVHEPFDQYTERLALSEQQAEQIRPILQENREKIGLLRDQYQRESPAHSTVRSFSKEREDLRQETEKRLAILLSDKQMTEYGKMEKEEREKIRQGYGGSRGRSRR
jgi:hypothetical protein